MRATSCGPVKAGIESAEMRYEDREVVVNKNLVTSGNPSDLPSCMREFMNKLVP